VINESKNGKFPMELEKNLPEIAKIIKKMLAHNPSERPSLEIISSHLRLPFEFNVEVSGAMTFRKENSELWENKHFKLMGKNMYIFNNEQDKKAENVFTLSEWTVLVNHEEGTENTTCVTLEDPLRLGCSLKIESCEQTTELLNQLRKYIS